MDRKQHIRHYKETPRPMGIVRVRNKVSGRSLVASSLDVPATLNRQRFQLELGAHPEPALQADWKALGPAAFDFSVLDELKPAAEPGRDPKADLELLLAMWREKLTALGEGDFYRA